MIVEICGQQKTYEQFFAVLRQELCSLKKRYVQYFEKVLQDQHEVINRLDKVQLRNIGKLFGHLIVTNCISLGVCIDFNINIK